MLEAIKDGTTINGKYQSEVLRFKTINIVIIFSNDDSDVMQLLRGGKFSTSPKRDLNIMTDDCLREKMEIYVKSKLYICF